jgi:3-dehydroquinate synthase
MDFTKLQIETKEPYPVLIGTGLLNGCGKIISGEIKPFRAALISDENVMSLYGKCVESSLKEAGFQVISFAFPAGEKSKTPQTLFEILNVLAENGFDRSDVVVALGGGVAGDIAGFASAVYMRGMKLVQIPTSLLAMVDSSVGGKTAVDLPQGKNLAGAFKQPQIVICDTETILSLPGEQFSCGMAEVIKYAMICDEELFGLLQDANGENGLTEEMLIRVITRCVDIKGKIVSRDEFDIGERRLLNFGHTVGHAVEKCSGYTLNHGQAVGIGMTVITDISEKLGLCSYGTKEKLIGVLTAFKIPSATEFSAKALFEGIVSDKKRSGEEIALVLTKRIGECVCRNFQISEVEGLLRMSVEGKL